MDKKKQAAGAHAIEPLVIDSEDEEHPRSKRARVASPPVADTRPKWSNPDPYTVLPPPGESQAKGKAVMKLIQKQKVEAVQADDKKAAADDFISLNFDDDDASDDDGSSSGNVVQVSGQSTSTPAFSHLDHLHPDRSRNTSERSSGSGLPTPRDGAASVDVWPPPPADVSGKPILETAIERQDAAAIASQPSQKRGRKRKFDRGTDVGDIDASWRVRDHDTDVDPTPWLNIEREMAGGVDPELW